MRNLVTATAIILWIDWYSKSKMLYFLADGPLWFIPDKVGFELVFNPGVAFSFPLPYELSVLIGVGISLALIAYFKQKTNQSSLAVVGFSLVIGGALGNVYDRVQYGAVVDFIHLYWYPVFNVADVAVCLGFVWILLFHNRFEKLSNHEMRP